MQYKPPEMPNMQSLMQQNLDRAKTMGMSHWQNFSNTVARADALAAQKQGVQAGGGTGDEQAYGGSGYAPGIAAYGSDNRANQLGGIYSQLSDKVPRSLIKEESSFRWNASNDEEGAGGLRGHFGFLQFGQARMREAMNAGVIPKGMTPKQFMSNPQAQIAAANWHFDDIDNTIKKHGFDQMVGRTINGVPITMGGMRAVAHLGGQKGMIDFIRTNGRYNPADANRTRLSQYFRDHAG
jgi:hypothetical protein